MAMEEWRTIPGYEGLYEASNMGRIRSAPYKTTSNARFPERHWNVRVLKEKHQTTRKRKDGRVSLWVDGKEKTHLVSRLVALAWHGLPPDNYTVNHINGDWSDNSAENLEWIPLSENIKHGFRTGLYSSIQKSVILTDSRSDTYVFDSLADADRFLGRAVGYTSGALIKNRTIRSSNGVVYYAKQNY